jgi:hypothetical protein
MDITLQIDTFLFRLLYLSGKSQLKKVVGQLLIYKESNYVV